MFAFEYFDNISQAEYNKYLNSYNGKWFIKTESIKYYIQDCISLHQIVTLFNKLIFDKFKLNINKYPTLSLLSFSIFCAKYLNNLKTSILMLSRQINKKNSIEFLIQNIYLIYTRLVVYATQNLTYPKDHILSIRSTYNKHTI